MNLENIVSENKYESGLEVCPGCENHCTVKSFRFANGKTFYSGNQCERVYGAQSESLTKGVNMFVEKNKLLWNRPLTPTKSNGIRIGIPRGLGIYEDFPFWCKLLTECGFEVVLSKGSTNKLYEKGIRTIVADNICFPAKLMHGHILDLIERKVDRILYPWVVYERKEDRYSKNSYNCPIVSGYSDVIKSSIDPYRNANIPIDAPTVSFKDNRRLTKSCLQYLASLGVSKPIAQNAITKAIDEMERYLTDLERLCEKTLLNAIRKGKMVIVLAARPYHIDPLIEHKVSQAIADMGIDVITENVASNNGSEVYNHINALCQWAYPNRIFKAAWYVGEHPYPKLHMVELTSFGCGPDAFILDEVRSILGRFEKNLTVLKIDDVNNIGSLKLRIRSLVESAHTSTEHIVPQENDYTERPYTTKPFLAEDRSRTIIAPYFAEGYSEYIPTIMGMMGYKVVCLPMGCLDDAEEGLKDANNDICYPATIVVGSILRALRSGEYNPAETAVAITQTGGQCRASNYYSLIKNAMVAAGFADIPVISVALGQGLKNTQPGFVVPWRKMWRITMYTILFADTMLKLYYPAVVRETVRGAAKKIYDKYTSAVQPHIAANNIDGMLNILKSAVREFCEVTDMTRHAQRVGLVGEIYVKYNSFSNKNVVKWLIDRGIEVVPPALSGFFLTKLPNIIVNRELNIQAPGMSNSASKLINRYIMHTARRFDKICQPFLPYRPFTDIFDNYKLAKEVINPAANFGEGWFLPGEICHLAENGVDKIVSVQPFGCIANHIISKGIEKRLKERYPNLSLLFLDFDSGTSEVNVQNRLHFMLAQ